MPFPQTKKTTTLSNVIELWQNRDCGLKEAGLLLSTVVQVATTKSSTTTFGSV